jgi:riboflavin biosynthesis pyrimidine reductase
VLIGGGANVAQQFLKAGLIDEIQIHLVPVLLGAGTRLFGDPGDGPTELATTRVVESSFATHLGFRVKGSTGESRT